MKNSHIVLLVILSFLFGCSKEKQEEMISQTCFRCTYPESIPYCDGRMQLDACIIEPYQNSATLSVIEITNICGEMLTMNQEISIMQEIIELHTAQGAVCEEIE